MTLPLLKKKILQQIQKSIPLVSHPYKAIADTAGISEEECLSIIKELRERNIIRNISGIFNPDALGYTTTLVAFSINNDKLEAAGHIINSYPGVSHNYVRDHELNLWFTLAVDKNKDIDSLVDFLAQKCAADRYMVFPREKQLKLEMVLPIFDEKNIIEKSNNTEYGNKTITLTEHERLIVILLQNDLPLLVKPFRIILNENNCNISEQKLFETMKDFMEKGIMRRYAAVLKHHNAGYTVNAMTVWKYDRQAQAEKYQPFINEPAISHLYVRTAYPGTWEYPLFAMVHARTEAELSQIIENLAIQSGINEYRMLRSVKEFKKQRVAYFSPRFEEWHNREHV